MPELGLMPWIHEEFLRVNKEKDNVTKNEWAKNLNRNSQKKDLNG